MLGGTACYPPDSLPGAQRLVYCDSDLNGSCATTSHKHSHALAAIPTNLGEGKLHSTWRQGGAMGEASPLVQLLSAPLFLHFLVFQQLACLIWNLRRYEIIVCMIS